MSFVRFVTLFNELVTCPKNRNNGDREAPAINIRSDHNESKRKVARVLCPQLSTIIRSHLVEVKIK